MRAVKISVCLALVCSFAGCTSLPTDPYQPHDPFEKFNRASYEFTEVVDRNAVRPIARGYDWLIPEIPQQLVLNFFQNLRGINSAVNGYLQGKLGRGSVDLARLGINTTFGIGGLLDVATEMGLEYGNEDLGQTFAVWGATKTRYVFIPLLGPSTIRDIPGVVVRGLTPAWILGSDYPLALIAVDFVSARADALSLTDVRDAAALDPYAFTRDAYYQRRRFDVFDGDPPIEDFGDEFDDFDGFDEIED